MRLNLIAGAILSAVLLAPHPVLADGGASTRNIILGGAAAAGTLLIINRNKKVHERYAEDAQRQAAYQAERNQAQAAYESERSAYRHQIEVNADLQKEVAVQHKVVLKLEHELALTKRSTLQAVSKGAPSRSDASKNGRVSYGWGHL